MYPNEASATSSIPIPKQRRRYFASPLSSSPMVSAIDTPSQLVKGYAHLCFCEDGSWFEGHLITKDDSQYGVAGRCPQMLSSSLFSFVAGSNGSPDSSEDASPDSDSTNSTTPFVAYDVTVNDHDDEESYDFPSVLLTAYYPLCALLSSRFSFTAEKAFKGQKADMLIQRYLTPRLVGKNLKVFAGYLTVDLSPQPHSMSSSFKSSSPLWCL